MNRLSALYGAGDYRGLEEQVAGLLENFPDFAFLWQALGVARNAQGKDGVPALRQAVRLMPGDATALSNLGNALKDAGQRDEAEAAYRQALAIEPRDPLIHYNLGTVLQAGKRFAEAAQAYREALALRPGFAEALYNQGLVLEELGETAAADAAYRAALAARPEYVDALNNLGLLLAGRGELDAAVACYEKAIALAPQRAGLYSNLGRALSRLNRDDEAESNCRRAIAGDPGNADLHCHLGLVLVKRGDKAAAEASYRRALELDPGLTLAGLALADLLSAAMRFGEAEQVARQAMARDPDYSLLYVCLAGIRMNQGFPGECIEILQRGLEVDPESLSLYDNLLFQISYDGARTAAEMLAVARRYGALASRLAKQPYTAWGCDDGSRGLRVGVVSGDLRDHSVGHFVEGLLPELAASGIELIAYPTGDEVTPLSLRIKPHFAAWRSLSGLSDEAAAARIHADGVHVLLDLSGHTAYSRLTLFAWKPAPVQASWLGYCATTGLAEMDWYIADGVTLPPALEGFFTERIWRLPENYLCFSKPQEDVAVAALPALRRGGLTFGSFNNLSKMTDEAVALWSRLLKAVPGSRLLLKTMQMRDETVRERVRARYAAQGIGDDRLILQGPVAGRGGHLEVYGEVDIGLDPFPYNGVTTTMEALWMGVPVLTLAGERFLARQGMGIMSGAGLGDWVAADGAALIARAQYWAAHLDELAALRAGLRERLLASPLLDAPRFARHFAAALHGMWQQRPAGIALSPGLPPLKRDSLLCPGEYEQLLEWYRAAEYGRLIERAERLVAQNPASAEVWKILGLAREALAQDGLPALERAVALQATDADCANDLALALHRRGRLAEATALYRRALALRPGFATAAGNLAMCLHAQGQLAEAETWCRQALAAGPDDAQAWSNLGVVLKAQRRLAEAEGAYRRAIALRPDYAEGHYNFAVTLQEARRLDEAAAAYGQAIAVRPDYVEAHCNLGALQRELGQLAAAESSLQRALAIRPGHAGALNNLGIVRRECGDLLAAESLYEQALAAAPNFTEALSNLLYVYNYDGRHSPAECREAARRFGQLASRLAKQPYTAWGCDDGSRGLRVGVVSGDLRDHSVGHFVEGLLPELAASGIELIAYPTGDEVTPLSLRIKPYFAAWRSLSGLSDEAAAARIHADGVHVLLDLSGHTAYSRLTLFAWKPAPVQASWLGYCATTGLAEMDWYIADGVTLPPALEGFFTERIWRLPENYLCFSKPQEDVAVAALPALQRGGLTFGSFNNLSKMTDEAVALWSRLLKAVPGSRLLLKTMQMRDETVRERVRARYAAQGIGDDRLILQGPVAGRGGHLEVYGEVDIGLDPFPYNGVTTTMEALWMGVPVLTLAGERFLARQGMGIMSGAGLGDWVAADGEALIARAQYWAAHLDELAALRAGLRERLLASPLLDAPRFARHFAAALHGMWQQRPAAQNRVD